MLRKQVSEARVRRSYVFSNRAAENIKYILSMGGFNDETEVIEASIKSFISNLGELKRFPEPRVRKDRTLSKDTIEAMGTLIDNNIVRNENETVDLAIEQLATIYRTTESVGALPKKPGQRNGKPCVHVTRAGRK